MKQVLILFILFVFGMTNSTSPPVEARHEPLNRRPDQVTIIAFKREKVVEVWFGDNEGVWMEDTYPIVTSSGTLGPKLKQGDKQTPEGIYKIESINTESKYTIFMLLDYPNTFDLEKAEEDGRTNLGGSIGIHGGDYSVGCLAIGDAIEALYDHILLVGIDKSQVVIVPYDFRVNPYVDGSSDGWLNELYNGLNNLIQVYQ